MKRILVMALITTFTLVFALGILLNSSGKEHMPFGGEDDVEFANMVWKAMKGYENWPMKSGFYPGKSPHGKFLRLYYNIVNVDDKPYHVIIKDNFGGEDATMEKVSDSPEEYLAAVTIMVQREKGYDQDNNNWFWVKYKADGSIDKNEKGMALAGKVAKGMDTGCIACHANAEDGDYVFTNDEMEHGH